MKDMAYKSQNNEAEVVINYFNGRIGCLLDLGANDGITFSNSYDLIQLGWKAHLVEPVEECWARICEMYGNNHHIVSHCIAIGIDDKINTFYIPADSLLSSGYGAVANTQQRAVQFATFDSFHKRTNYRKFNFITIDCEGMDWDILQQMDLTEIGCECICIEHSGLFGDIINYCAKFGLTKELLRNGENIILAK